MSAVLIGDPGGGVEPDTIPFGDFFVEAAPLPQPRPKGQLIQRKGTEPFIHIYTPSGTKGSHAKWREAIWRAARIIVPESELALPVKLTINIYVKRPQAMMGTKWPDGPIPHTARGDLDNFEKAVMDALSPAKATKAKRARRGLWTDDALVCVKRGAKYYAAKAGPMGAYVRIDVVPLREEPESLFG